VFGCLLVVTPTFVEGKGAIASLNVENAEEKIFRVLTLFLNVIFKE